MGEQTNEPRVAAGDVVQLKSGSPLMTVQRVEGEGSINGERATCVWFGSSWEIRSAEIATVTLERRT